MGSCSFLGGGGAGGDLPHPRIKPASPEFPALQVDSLPSKPAGKHILETSKQTTTKKNNEIEKDMEVWRKEVYFSKNECGRFL